MIRKAADMRFENIKEMRGGEGEVKVIHMMERNEFHDKGRLFAHNILKPGASIGMHPHIGDFEAYYVIKGEGIFFEDEGVENPIKQGDMGYVEVGKSHGIKNTGTTDMEIIALVLFE